MLYCKTLLYFFCQKKGLICHRGSVLSEHTKIMCTAVSKGCGDDLHSSLVNNYLCFLGVTFLFAAVVSLLLFFRRSIGCSLTSTSTTERTSASSTLLMVRQTVDTLMPHEPAI